MDVNGLVLKMKSKKRKMISFSREQMQLDALIGHPPLIDECYKLISVGGGFSICGIIRFVASMEKIEEMWVSTFRIGKKQFDELIMLNNRERLEKCHFITSQTQKNVDTKVRSGGREYNYYDYICEKCKKLGWEIKHYDNHSKVCLMKTNKNWYVVETSSNLNENPKMEQFSFENDKRLYEFYKKILKELLKM